MSKVMQSGTGKIKFPINEPAEGRKIMIDEYFEFYHGAGVQHIANEHYRHYFNCCDLKPGPEFTVPTTYYDDWKAGWAIDEDVNDLKELGVLSIDEDGYSSKKRKPAEDRPTFFRIIQ
jgi:4-hydroxyphenylpyruvate dioxygenase